MPEFLALVLTRLGAICFARSYGVVSGCHKAPRPLGSDLQAGLTARPGGQEGRQSGQLGIRRPTIPSVSCWRPPPWSDFPARLKSGQRVMVQIRVSSARGRARFGWPSFWPATGGPLHRPRMEIPLTLNSGHRRHDSPMPSVAARGRCDASREVPIVHPAGQPGSTAVFAKLGAGTQKHPVQVRAFNAHVRTHIQLAEFRLSPWATPH